MFVMFALKRRLTRILADVIFLLRLITNHKWLKDSLGYIIL